jgi:hypothetical protein
MVDVSTMDGRRELIPGLLRPREFEIEVDSDETFFSGDQTVIDVGAETVLIEVTKSYLRTHVHERTVWIVEAVEIQPRDLRD